MTMTIPLEFAHFVEDEVASGRFRSPEDVLAAALTLLRESEKKWCELKADIDAGLEALDAGDVVDFDPQDIQARGRARLATKDRSR